MDEQREIAHRDPEGFPEDPEDFEPSAQDLRDMIDAEGEAMYEQWLDFAEPYDYRADYAGDRFACARLSDAEESWATEFEARLSERHEQFTHRGSWPSLGRGHLDGLAGFDEAVGYEQHLDCFAVESDVSWVRSHEHSPSVEDKLGLDYDTLAAGREIAHRDPTFFPALRQLGPTPAMISRANAILHRRRVTTDPFKIAAFFAQLGRRDIRDTPLYHRVGGGRERRPATNCSHTGSRRGSSTRTSSRGGDSGDSSDPPPAGLAPGPTWRNAGGALT